MIKKLISWLVGFPKRAYTVMELRTGFATGLPILSSGLFGAYLVGHLRIIPLVLFFICGYSFNIVANVANEIRAYLKNEEDDKTLTEHFGSEGLVRGDATLLDAVLNLLGVLGIGGISGLGLTWLLNSWLLLVLGILGLVAALTYSLGPKPYIVYPVGEFVSGLFVGGLSSLLSSWIQVGQLILPSVLYAWICMMLTVFLMSTNNTGDYEKDLGVRRTLPHVIGFRASILIIIPEFITVLVAWAMLGLTVIPWWVFLIGLIIFYVQGYKRWYQAYYKIQKVYPEMGREFGPRPLLVIYHFHGWLTFIFWLLLIKESGKWLWL
ncbi:prenyltransferase [Vagococcus intermedius]|uniref:Prenyltransferase n=1 Tax=Vagococcus intermedius TaxID=2991418 RepID=A0AAF0CVX6_9ENTE|nr:prenyltransferase [Vagococcus intermedius]WEG73672.1 prenyltransferase [Vagococcus intermedius]WEG75756.1 prenyltransferase [Vagococcus intermedius]